MSVIEKVDREAVEMCEKIEDQRAFIATADFRALPESVRRLAYQQLSLMENYENFLVAQLRWLERQEKTGGM